MVWGTDAQKERYLPTILNAEESWCQGFSEPDAGSDLASLKTRAGKDGDKWVGTGQNVWTWGAQFAKWCMLVARTDSDAPKHKGLTYFLMDMDQEEVQVRPLRQITGEAEFNELFIGEARVPHENIVGGEDNGWSVAITTLMHERSGLAFGAMAQVRRDLNDLIELAREHGLDEDPVTRQRIAQLHMEVEALRINAYRGLTGIMKTGHPGPARPAVAAVGCGGSDPAVRGTVPSATRRRQPRTGRLGVQAGLRHAEPGRLRAGAGTARRAGPALRRLGAPPRHRVRLPGPRSRLPVLASQGKLH